MNDQESSYREDCDPACQGYDRRKGPCCGGCPAQCYCRAEAQAETVAERERIAEIAYYGPEAIEEYEQSRIARYGQGVEIDEYEAA